ncbi:MAG: phytanoyl-CoA dioxygenase family protein [Alphaproteobacteria bacterium]
MQAGDNEMQQAVADDAQVEAIVEELMNGRGYYVLEDAYDAATVAEARARIVELASLPPPDVDKKDALSVLAATDHVWNLIDKGAVFERMVQHPTVLAVFARILGSEFKLGSYAARIQRPGAEGQLPHLDYPYWDLYDRHTFPRNINTSFRMNCQVTVMLDDFTLENGATMVAPGTQLSGQWPDKDAFYRQMIQTTGRAGSAMLMTGLLWHGAGANRTDRPRVGLLGQFLPKFVKPMEDQLRSVRQEVIDRASPTLRALLGVDYPYPQVLDTGAGAAY